MRGAESGAKWTMHPEWIGRSIIPVTLVCGPPASGKSTYVDTHKGHADLVIDLDAIASGMARTSMHAWGAKWLGPAVRKRNELIGSLSKPDALRHGKAWLVVAEPEAERRQWWVDMLGCSRVVVVESPASQCEARIASDAERSMQAGRASQWWAAYTRRDDDERLVAIVRKAL
jgi:predicted kinase